MILDQQVFDFGYAKSCCIRWYGQGVVREKELRCFYLIIHTNYASQTILSAQCGLYWSTNDWTAV